MIRWKLNETMARYRISNRLLAERLGRHETSISRMRTADTMPRFSGDELNAICMALTAIAGETISPGDLLEFSPD